MATDQNPFCLVQLYRRRNFLLVPGVNIAGTLVPTADKVITLGVTLDRHLVLSHHTSSVCRAVYFHIRCLRHIRVSLTEDMAIAVAVSMVHSCLDYANSVVCGQTNVKKTAVSAKFCCQSCFDK